MTKLNNTSKVVTATPTASKSRFNFGRLLYIALTLFVGGGFTGLTTAGAMELTPMSWLIPTIIASIIVPFILIWIPVRKIIAQAKQQVVEADSLKGPRVPARIDRLKFSGVVLQNFTINISLR